MGAAYLAGPVIRSQRRSGCTGKHAFNSNAEARLHIREASKTGVRLSAYKCKVCNHYHLTSTGLIRP